MTAQDLIDSLERDLTRAGKVIDPALLASLIARLDELRRQVA
jgi:hypothetical protein